MDFDDIVWRGWPWAKEELIDFGMIPLTLQDRGLFDILANI